MSQYVLIALKRKFESFAGRENFMSEYWQKYVDYVKRLIMEEPEIKASEIMRYEQFVKELCENDKVNNTRQTNR